MPPIDPAELLRLLGDLQAVLAAKGAQYARSRPLLASRFARASYAAINARVLIQAAMMAERETVPTANDR